MNTPGLRFITGKVVSFFVYRKWVNLRLIPRKKARSKDELLVVVLEDGFMRWRK